MKWYYWVAIAVGLLLAYVLFLAPSSSGLRPGSKPQTTTGGWGGILTGVGNAAGGLSDLWDSIAGRNSEEIATNAEIGR